MENHSDALFPGMEEAAAPDVSLTAPKRWRLVLEGRVRLTYDDNINTQPDNEQSDIVLTIAPRLSLEVGDFREKKENFLLLIYAPIAYLFLEDKADDTLDHDVAFEAQAAFPKTLLSAALRFHPSPTAISMSVNARTAKSIPRRLGRATPLPARSRPTLISSTAPTSTGPRATTRKASPACG